MNKNNSINESCKQICCGRTKFYQLLNDGYIKALKLGNKTLIPQSSIDDYLASLPAYPVKGGQSDAK